MAEVTQIKTFGGPQFEPFGVEGFAFLSLLDKLGNGTILDISFQCKLQPEGIQLPLNSLFPLSKSLESGGYIKEVGTFQVRLTEEKVILPIWLITNEGRMAIARNQTLLRKLNVSGGDV